MPWGATAATRGLQQFTKKLLPPPLVSLQPPPLRTARRASASFSSVSPQLHLSVTFCGRCSGFDRLTSACTLAGSATACTGGMPVLGLPSQSTFCALTAIAGRGRSLFLADSGVLIQYDLLAQQTPLRAFAATPFGTYARFCSLAPLPLPSVAVAAHECASQQVRNMPSHSAPSPPAIAAPRRSAPRICAIAPSPVPPKCPFRLVMSCYAPSKSRLLCGSPAI